MSDAPDESTGESTRAPKYVRVRQQLESALDGIPAGRRIDPERVLARRFGVSRETIRQALQDLSVEGRLIRVQGSGTFVASPKLTQQLALTSFTEDVTTQGRHPGSRLLELRPMPADPDTAGLLGVQAGTTVVRIRRLRTIDEQPAAVETVHLRDGLVDDLDRLGAPGASLYALLTANGVQLVEAYETIETVLAAPASAELLGVETGAPLLKLNRTTGDREGRVIEHVSSLYRGDRYRFAVRLRRPDGSVDGSPTIG